MNNVHAAVKFTKAYKAGNFVNTISATVFVRAHPRLKKPIVLPAADIARAIAHRSPPRPSCCSQYLPPPTSTCSPALLLTLYLLSAQAKTVGEIDVDRGGEYLRASTCITDPHNSVISDLPRTL